MVASNRLTGRKCAAYDAVHLASCARSLEIMRLQGMIQKCKFRARGAVGICALSSYVTPLRFTLLH
eukprot:9351878-Heterocapsa_arctica.AAC.1